VRNEAIEDIAERHAANSVVEFETERIGINPRQLDRNSTGAISINRNKALNPRHGMSE